MEELLTKYIHNKCDLVERQQVIDWLQNPDNDWQRRTWMWQHWHQSQLGNVPALDREALWHDISLQAGIDLTEPSLFQSIRQQIVRTAIWILCIILIGLAIRFIRYIQAPEVMVYQTGANQQMRVKLLDGSAVVLNSNSTLRVASDWSDINRYLEFEGEGYFMIVRQPHRYRLQVHLSDQVQIETEHATFLVSRRSAKNSVAVYHKSVKLHLQNQLFGYQQDFKLLSGDRLDYYKNENRLVKQKINLAFLPKWLRQKPDMVIDLKEKVANQKTEPSYPEGGLTLFEMD